jgi:hypothetical protein
MALNYIVVLDRKCPNYHFHDVHFPRGTHYRQTAEAYVEEVKEHGGKAHVVPKSQFTSELLQQVVRSQSAPKQ